MKEPSQSKLAVGCLARDCRWRLPRLLRRLEDLASHFAETSVVIVENGSRDGTREALQQWTPRSARAFLPPAPELPRFDGEPRHDFPRAFFDRRRIGKMTFLRNVCLDEIRARAPDADYAMLLDLDVRDFSVSGAMSSFEADEDWDVVAANGLEVDRAFGPWVYRDAYAFYGRDERCPRRFDDLGPLQRALPGQLARSRKLMPVAAAFGGLSFFRAEAIFAARYELTPNADSVVAYECEHVSLLRMMREAGYGRVFINPRMKLRYNNRLERCRLEAEMAARRLFRTLVGSTSG